MVDLRRKEGRKEGRMEGRKEGRKEGGSAVGYGLLCVVFKDFF